MSVLKVGNDNFKEEVLNSEVPVLIDFYADWCGPCKMMGPVVEEISDEIGGKIKVAKVNVDENQDLAEQYGIMSIPTLLFFKDGNLVEQSVGLISKSEIIEIINKL